MSGHFEEEVQEINQKGIVRKPEAGLEMALLFL